SAKIDITDPFPLHDKESMLACGAGWTVSQCSNGGPLQAQQPCGFPFFSSACGGVREGAALLLRITCSEAGAPSPTLPPRRGSVRSRLPWQSTTIYSACETAREWQRCSPGL